MKESIFPRVKTMCHTVSLGMCALGSLPDNYRVFNYSHRGTQRWKSEEQTTEKHSTSLYQAKNKGILC